MTSLTRQTAPRSSRWCCLDYSSPSGATPDIDASDSPDRTSDIRCHLRVPGFRHSGSTLDPSRRKRLSRRRRTCRRYSHPMPDRSVSPPMRTMTTLPFRRRRRRRRCLTQSPVDRTPRWRSPVSIDEGCRLYRSTDRPTDQHQNPADRRWMRSLEGRAGQAENLGETRGTSLGASPPPSGRGAMVRRRRVAWRTRQWRRRSRRWSDDDRRQNLNVTTICLKRPSTSVVVYCLTVRLWRLCDSVSRRR